MILAAEGTHVTTGRKIAMTEGISKIGLKEVVETTGREQEESKDLHKFGQLKATF
jgi:hypothetical protein